MLEKKYGRLYEVVKVEIIFATVCFSFVLRLFSIRNFF